MSEEEKEIHSRFAESLGELMRHTLNEGVLLEKMDEFFSPRPAKLVHTQDEAKDLGERLSKLSERLGGPSILNIADEDESKLPLFDTYGVAALQEILTTFHRCRRATSKAHLFFIGSSIVRNHPDWWNPPIEKEDAIGYSHSLENRFWEEVETAYIRLASFWDRMGQLMDFIFFNIRQYERDGFSSVMDRIHVNYIPLYPNFNANAAWRNLRSYQTAENENGFKWLIRRRNLLVHSLHLGSFHKAEKEHPMFTSAYNHLSESVKKKLKPMVPEQELNQVHAHLEAAANLFKDVLDVCDLNRDIALKHVSP